MSIERDEQAHKTLFLRHFLRYFPGTEFPDDYYSYLSGEITLSELYSRNTKEFRKAEDSAPRISLEPATYDEVRKLIIRRLVGAQRWALVSGPSCQAYPLVGRSRMKGDPKFEKYERHFLYREYLKIIVDHRPPVFVMENVKGLLSSKISDEPIINRILADLASPKAALVEETNGFGYRLCSLSNEGLADIYAEPGMSWFVSNSPVSQPKMHSLKVLMASSGNTVWTCIGFPVWPMPGKRSPPGGRITTRSGHIVFSEKCRHLFSLDRLPDMMNLPHQRWLLSRGMVN